MKKILFTLVLAMATVQGFAQLQLGIRDAIVSAVYTGDLGDATDEVFIGDALTFELNYKLNENMSIHPSIGFEVAALTEEQVYYGQEVDYNIAYLDLILPVMFRYNFTPGWFAEVGPQFSFNIATAVWFDDEDAEEAKDAESFDFGIAFGAGYVFHFGLGLDARYTVGLTDKSEYVDGSMGRFYFGLSYWFKR